MNNNKNYYRKKWVCIEGMLSYIWYSTFCDILIGNVYPSKNIYFSLVTVKILIFLLSTIYITIIFCCKYFPWHNIQFDCNNLLLILFSILSFFWDGYSLFTFSMLYIGFFFSSIAQNAENFRERERERVSVKLLLFFLSNIFTFDFFSEMMMSI